MASVVRVALVTGSSAGIGLAIARAFARRNMNVVVHGFGATANAAELETQIAAGTTARLAFSDADLGVPDEAARLVEFAVERFGRIDILVNNAGIQHVAPIETFAPADWDRVLAVNLTAPFRAIQAALPHMRRQRWGRVINTASVHGLVASKHKSAYVAAKHALVGLTKAVALETAGSGVTCNAVCPGWVLTDLVAKQVQARADTAGISWDEAAAQLVGEKQPSAAFVPAEDVAELCAFLSSDAAGHMTGVSVPIDGAWTAQ